MQKTHGEKFRLNGINYFKIVAEFSLFCQQNFSPFAVSIEYWAFYFQNGTLREFFLFSKTDLEPVKYQFLQNNSS